MIVGSSKRLALRLLTIGVCLAFVISSFVENGDRSWVPWVTVLMVTPWFGDELILACKALRSKR